MPDQPVVEINAITHRGRLRADNQDSITVAGWVSDIEMSGSRRSRHALEEPLLIAVADGMGGRPAGDIASRYTVKRLALAHVAVETDVAAILGSINAELYQTMAASADFLGMGTTVVGLVLTADRATWFNVGDSRIYQYRDGRLVQLSVDDVPANARPGLISQALGGSLVFTPAAPHVGGLNLLVPSRWLLCSDGLTGVVDDARIARAMEGNDQEALAALFTQAMEAGAPDNISIVTVSVHRSEAELVL